MRRVRSKNDKSDGLSNFPYIHRRVVTEFGSRQDRTGQFRLTFKWLT